MSVPLVFDETHPHLTNQPLPCRSTVTTTGVLEAKSTGSAAVTTEATLEEEEEFYEEIEEEEDHG